MGAADALGLGAPGAGELVYNPFMHVNAEARLVIGDMTNFMLLVQKQLVRGLTPWVLKE